MQLYHRVDLPLEETRDQQRFHFEAPVELGHDAALPAQGAHLACCSERLPSALAGSAAAEAWVAQLARLPLNGDTQSIALDAFGHFPREGLSRREGLARVGELLTRFVERHQATVWLFPSAESLLPTFEDAGELLEQLQLPRLGLELVLGDTATHTGREAAATYITRWRWRAELLETPTHDVPASQAPEHHLLEDATPDTLTQLESQL